MDARARGTHERVLTLDTHVDIPDNYATEEVDPGVRGNAQVDLPKMEEGGLNAAFFIVVVGQTKRTPENYEKAKRDAMTKFDAIHRMAEQMYPDRIELAGSAADVNRIHSSGKLVALIGIENGYVIGKDVSLLEKYHELGARYITLAHGGHNDIADSSTPRPHLGDGEAEHGGVSEFGEQVIAEMNRVGIMVDVSHVSKQAMLEAVALSKAPVIGSHSSTRALADVPRNMDDEQLRALAQNGGVMQTVALGDFVKALRRSNRPWRNCSRSSASATWLGWHPYPRSSARPCSRVGRRSPLAAPSRYRISWTTSTTPWMGIDHVGISSDFDGGGGVQGWNDASETLNVTNELVRRGYTELQIEQLWSGNLLRVLSEVERVAAELQGTGG